MELQSVRIQNFLSVESAVVDYSGNGTTLVVGPTGSGKSALMVESLLWLFYDLLNREVSRSEMSGVRRRYRMQPVEESTSVEAWFKHAGHDYYAKRSLKDGWEISCDGTGITPYRAKADGVAAMRQIVGLPPHLFRAIAVMGQGFHQRFSGFKDSDRTTIIEDFLGAAAFEQGQREAKDKLSAVESVLSGLTARRDALRQAVQTTQEQLQTAQQQVNEWKAHADATRQRLETESSAIGADRAEKTQQLEELEAAQLQLVEAKRQWEMSEVDANRDVETGVAEVSRLQAQKTQLVSRRQSFEGLGPQCPTCLQPVDGAIIQQTISEDASLVTGLEPQIGQAENQLASARQRLQDAKTHLITIRQQETLRTAEQNRLRNSISLIDQRFEQIQSELSQLGDSEILAEQNLRAVQDRLTGEQQQLEQVETAVAEHESLKPYLNWWVEGFSIRGIRSKRLGSVLETMNVNLASYCQQLFEDQVLVRLLPIKPQKTAAAKSVVSLDVSSPAGSYALSSGGQERCIDLSIHFALRRFAQQAAFGWSSNFLIGDEVFDHLDRPLAERALQILKGEAQRVFLITHSPELQALCDSVWHVRYEDERTVL